MKESGISSQPQATSTGVPAQLVSDIEVDMVEFQCNVGHDEVTISSAKHPGSTELAARISSYELAYRMQSCAPEAVDISKEILSFAKNGITYMYKGKQYVAIYHTMPAPTALPGGLGSLASNQREQMTVFTL